MVKCRDCNRDFQGVDQLNRHLATAPNHACCRQCRNGFESARKWNSHFYTSHASAQQTRKVTSNQEELALSTSLRTLAIAVVSVPLTYCGVPGNLIKPVFKMACQLRFEEPTPELVISRTKTELGHDIVSAIVESALRLLPAENTPQGIQARREKAIEKARQAEEAESAFINRLLEIDPHLLREIEQQVQIKAALDAGFDDVSKLTPDARLSKPTLICGKECTWVEFKNTFGFRSSPFVAAKNKKQFSRYASKLGPGMVIFKLGYETNHFRIEGVHCFRETEVVQWLES